MKITQLFRYTLPTALLAIITLGMVVPTGDVSAVAASDWRPGMIIEDSLFYDNNAMSTTEIQNFLNSKVSSCDTWGTKPATEKGYPNMTHAQFAKMVGWPAPPYICLKNYYQVPRSDKIISNYNKTASRPSGSLSAAQIIKRAADTHKVSPKALLVLLHKESAGPLTLDTWPLLSQYKPAMGYACPDTAPCDAQYAGFYNQMMNAAKRIKNYKDNPTWYRHQPFAWNSTVYYHPDLARCGSSRVYIESRATAGLYNYTPYQPNTAALSNMYGTGDSCSAYGNRNFWRIYNDWFGPTSDNFVALDKARWMTLSKDTRKINTITKRPVDGTLSKGRQIYYEDKINIDNSTYVRTKTDKERGNNKAISYAHTTEIQPKPISTPRYMELNSHRYKIDPVTEKIDRSKRYPAGTVARFVKEIEVNGQKFYQTETDKSRGSGLYFRQVGVRELTYEPFSQPRFMEITSDTRKVSPASGTTEPSVIQSGTQMMFTSKIKIGEKWYYRTKDDTDSNASLAISADVVRDINYESFSNPAKYMSLTKDSKKVNPRTGQYIRNLSKQRYPEIKISRKITVDGRLYYQTQTDMRRQIDIAIPAEDIEEIAYAPLDHPRTLRLAKSRAKINPKTNQTMSRTYPKGLSVRYTTKIMIHGELYLRTEYDSMRDHQAAIPYSNLY